MEAFIGEPINIGGGQVFINPGTGPVDNANEADAHNNMRWLVSDAGLQGARIRRKRRLDDSGRFGFSVKCEGCTWDVEMPGLPLGRVRFTKGLDPWQFPRLYLDGSSWLWEFAVGIMKREINADDNRPDAR